MEIVLTDNPEVISFNNLVCVVPVKRSWGYCDRSGRNILFNSKAVNINRDKDD